MVPMDWKRRAQRATYLASQVLARLVGVIFFRIRTSGRDHVPADGGGLVCANHQSYFDPVIVGLTIDRQLTFLARKSLFRFPPFRWLIEWYNAIPLEREGLSMAGLKETIRRLKGGELVLIFPEGTRTRDGHLQSLKNGFCLVARRAKVPLIPVGLDGAYQAWPRQSRYPRLSRLGVVVGPVIRPEEFENWSDEQMVDELYQRMAAAHQEARRLRQAGRGDVAEPHS